MSPEIRNSRNLTPSEIKSLVGPMLLSPLPEMAYEQLGRYVHLLTRWNTRMNLTAVRDPKALVGLHIAECLRCAQMIPESVSSVLDFGSGAGLPGIPIQIARPKLTVTLAESQSKKAAFLQETVRELELTNTHVHSGRVEDLPANRTFDLVTLRAVDRMDDAIQIARLRMATNGFCMVLTSEIKIDAVRTALTELEWDKTAIPGTEQRVLLIGSKET